MHKILEIPDLFQLSVAKFMYSFYNGGLPNHFDNYYAEIASVHKYRFFAKILFTQNENVSGSAFFKVPCIGPKISSDIPENLKSFSPYSFAKQDKNALLSFQNSCWFSFCMLVTFRNIVLMSLLSLLSFTSTAAHPILCT